MAWETCEVKFGKIADCKGNRPLGVQVEALGRLKDPDESGLQVLYTRENPETFSCELSVHLLTKSAELEIMVIVGDAVGVLSRQNPDWRVPFNVLYPFVGDSVKSISWFLRAAAPTVGAGLWRCFEEGKYTDFTVKCSDGVEIKGHKVVLAYRGAFGAAIRNGQGDVRADFSAGVMRHVLANLYGSKKWEDESGRRLSYAESKEYLAACVLYDCSGGEITWAVEEFARNLAAGTIADALSFVSTYGESQPLLIRRVDAYVEKHPAEVRRGLNKRIKLDPDCA